MSRRVVHGVKGGLLRTRPFPWLPCRLVAAVACAALAASVAVVWWARRDDPLRSEREHARRLIAEGRFEEAQAPLQHWLKAQPDSAEAVFLVARGAIGLGMSEQGLRGLERARQMGYSPEAVGRRRAITLSELGRHEEAEPALRKLAGSGPPDPEVDQALARCYLETFQLRAAKQAIEQWVRHAPDDPRPYLWRTQLGRRTNASPEELAADFERALRLDPKSVEARVGLAEIRIQANRFEEALPHLTEALRIRPDDPSAHLGLGRALAGVGRDEEAVTALERASELAPHDVQPWIDRARIAVRRNRPDDALAALDRAVAIDPYEPEVHYQRGLALARLGRREEARRETEQTERLRQEHRELTDLLLALYERPSEADLQYRAARWFFEHGRPEEGQRWALRTLREHPSHPGTHALLADYFESRGNPGLANYHRLQAGPQPSTP
jgi:tetratricopeptide (TPR) repeat protein